MASGRIKGITIEIGGDTTKLSQALQGIDKDLRSTQSQLKDVNKLLKLDPKNVELLRQKQAGLEKSIKLTKDRLDELKKAQSQVQEGTAEWDALQREIIDTEGKLDSLEKEYKDFEKRHAKAKVETTGESRRPSATGTGWQDRGSRPEARAGLSCCGRSGSGSGKAWLRCGNEC